MFDKYVNLAIKVCLAASLGLLGLSFALNGNAKGMDVLLGFYHIDSIANSATLGLLIGVVMVFAAILVFANKPQLKYLGVGALLAIAVVFLLTLLSPSRYLQDLGGFPVLGSGQGIIKYVALLPLLLSVYFSSRFSLKQQAWLNYAPVAMVLLWIGGLKFFEFEAKGIVSLVSTSPFMSWLYEVFSVQQASNIIGIFDLVFAALLGLGLWFKHRNVMLLAILGCGSVFVMTQTFLFSAEGAFSSQTLLAGLGQFVIKDLWFIANLLVVAKYAQQLKSE
ncbi:hypothetical protein PSECIP111854_01163 [Pseudoalteromonas sp. CIP111854]|uniref:DUF417 family protein n=1 Tax=Pseudoalteromonas holothuriae TaxID=2963714 RepID=A0A9W4VT07_9GAMM|nr:YkgB family protein [Pseudoalteromonas sp. CIP111854]CAH9053399.1 hypothetical protein PSECIP111854_01163 [Pseudoalteromonas sp. CIP111854]